MTLDDFSKVVHAINESKGWNTHNMRDPDHIASMLALVHSEVSEALEAVRIGDYESTREDGKPEGVMSELADVVIRVMHLAERLRLAGVVEQCLSDAIETKIVYNKTRSFKHGGKII